MNFIAEKWYKFWTWYYYGRYYEAPLEPFSLILVSPSEIKAPQNKPTLKSRAVSGVEEGDWDKSNIPITKKSYFYTSLRNRVKNGRKWEDTVVYDRLIEAINNDEWWVNEPRLMSINNSSGDKESLSNSIVASLEEYERMYYKIKNDGYLTQKQLVDLENRYSSLINKRDLYNLNEVTVDIGRDGEILWVDGLHRVSIANLLELEKIPVRVRVRHYNWQKKRDDIYTSQQGLYSHPDLAGLY